MAKIFAQATGGAIQEKQASTVGEVKQLLGCANYTALVNGEAATDSQQLKDYDVVNLAPAVKGAHITLGDYNWVTARRSTYNWAAM